MSRQGWLANYKDEAEKKTTDILYDIAERESFNEANIHDPKTKSNPKNKYGHKDDCRWGGSAANGRKYSYVWYTCSLRALARRLKADNATVNLDEVEVEAEAEAEAEPEAEAEAEAEAEPESGKTIQQLMSEAERNKDEHGRIAHRYNDYYAVCEKMEHELFDDKEAIQKWASETQKLLIETLLQTHGVADSESVTALVDQARSGHGEVRSHFKEGVNQDVWQSLIGALETWQASCHVPLDFQCADARFNVRCSAATTPCKYFGIVSSLK
eukprot:SAG11_NODE_1339_length_5169_cov_2.613412_5_plen_270_part_00